MVIQTWRGLLGGVGVLMLLFGTTVLYAQSTNKITPAVQAMVRHIANQLRCPTCQAVSVRDSEAAFSVQIRQKVQRMVLEGQSEAQIKDFFVSRYGSWILRAPTTQGIGLLAWVAPLLVLALGGCWLFLRFGRQARKTVPPKTNPNLRAGVLKDLEHFERFAD